MCAGPIQTARVQVLSSVGKVDLYMWSLDTYLVTRQRASASGLEQEKPLCCRFNKDSWFLAAGTREQPSGAPPASGVPHAEGTECADKAAWHAMQDLL